MIADNWIVYLAARKQARKVYQDTIRAPRDAFIALDKEATAVYMKAIDKAKFAYKEASL